MKTRRILALEAKRDALATQLTQLDDAVIERGADLTDIERTDYDAWESELKEVSDDLTRLVEREARVGASVALGATLGNDAVNRDNGKISGGDAIYREQDVNRALVDLYNSRKGDLGAAQRVAAHNESIERASVVADIPGLVIPGFLTDKFVGIAKEGRPFLNSLPSENLTQGVITIPRQLTDVSVDSHTENVAFATADMSTEELTLKAKTVGGVAETSLESVTYGTLEGNILVKRLIENYHDRLDYLAFHGNSANTHQGVFHTSGVLTLNASGADTFKELYEAIFQAATAVRSAIKKNATHVAMSGAQWGRIAGATDDQGRPLVGFSYSAPQNVGGSAVVPSFAGLQVVVDDNIVASAATPVDDKIVVYRADEYILREANGGNPQTVDTDNKLASGTVQYVAYGFSIFSAAARPEATNIVTVDAV